MVTHLDRRNCVGGGETEVNVGGWVSNHVHLMAVLFTLDKQLFSRLGYSEDVSLTSGE